MTVKMRVRTLSSLALGGVPLEQWNALDAHVQQILFPSELRRAVGRFQRAVLKRRSRRRAAFEQAMTDRDKLCITQKCVTVQYVRPPLLSSGDHVMVWFKGCTHHGIVVCCTKSGVSVAELGDDGKMHIVDLEAFLRQQKIIGIVEYHHYNQGYISYIPRMPGYWEHLHPSLFPPYLTCTVDLATRMTTMHPKDLRAYDVMRQTPRCFAWVCMTGHLWCESQWVQRVLDAIDDCMRDSIRHIYSTYGKNLENSFAATYGETSYVREVQRVRAPRCAIM